ncbi:MAG: RIP metalloprotease RseP [Phycisphaerae bacterium]|nr:RIP metalloprotease RseP [Gemmatimonadaceae bacterium]
MTYLAPFLVFGLVVFVHELGHFLAAKLTGVYAPVFSLGWGTRLFGIRRGETDYRVSWFPIGGYVRMATRDDDSMAGIEGGRDRGELEGSAQPPREASALWDENSMAPFGPKAVPQSRWVESKSTSARVFIMSAGVMMNILLTIAVLSTQSYMAGNPYRPAIIDSTVAGMPAAVAGLTKGDVITSVNGQSVSNWNETVDRVAPVTEGTITLELQRGAERITRVITPEVSMVMDSATGLTKAVARVGMVPRTDTIGYNRGITTAISNGVGNTWFMTKQVGEVLRGLVTGQVSPKNLAGPITIARASVAQAEAGAASLWGLIAFLSLNIGILNLMPIPVLDGGQILLVLAERIKGSAFSAGVREGFARVGVFAVLGLFVLVMFNDVKAWIVN